MDRELFLEYLNRLENKVRKIRIIKRSLDLTPVEGKVTAVVGPRRAGKTYLMLDLLKNNPSSLYLDFEQFIFEGITKKEVFEAITFAENVKGEVKLILLDEIQELDGWEKLVRSLLDFGYEVVVSGSSSKLTSKEIATQLRGRSIEKLLLPLSFEEFLRFKGVENVESEQITLSQKLKLLKLLEKYLEIGSYPEVALNEERSDEILKNYFITVLYKDFIERFEFEYVGIARLILEFVMQNYSNEVSVRKIANFVASQVGRDVKDVVYYYVDKLPESLAVFFVERFDKNFYVRKSWPKKLYVCDVGLANTVRFGKDAGKRMENVVFLELMRRTNRNPLMEIYYFKARNYEVDFVVKDGLRVEQLIQVTYANDFDEVDAREWRALLKAKDVFGEHKPRLTVITWDYEDVRELSWFGKSGVVEFVPLWKFLLL